MKSRLLPPPNAEDREVDDGSPSPVYERRETDRAEDEFESPAAKTESATVPVTETESTAAPVAKPVAEPVAEPVTLATPALPRKFLRDPTGGSQLSGFCWSVSCRSVIFYGTLFCATPLMA